MNIQEKPIPLLRHFYPPRRHLHKTLRQEVLDEGPHDALSYAELDPEGCPPDPFTRDEFKRPQDLGLAVGWGPAGCGPLGDASQEGFEAHSDRKLGL